ncbi:MAG TPA: cytochrome b/b6 domain-containing protein [Chloroflexota bacterium]|nr:cytochrome b/b6 domain-containing protein [Chloroflexota bacterium]
MITAGSERTSPRATSPWIGRFTRTERLLHWSNAVSFMALAFTGFSLHISPLRRAWEAVLAPLPPLFGYPVTLIDVHIVVALFFIVGPVVWVVVGDRGALGADARDILHLDGDDRAWLARVASADPRSPLPPQGRFNAGQKLNAVATVLAFVGFLMTGIVIALWPSSAIGAASPVHAPYTAWHLMKTLHLGLALASVALLAGHVYLAALNRSTRHSLHGMLLGSVRRTWAREHHPKWVAAVEARESEEHRRGV